MSVLKELESINGKLHTLYNDLNVISVNRSFLNLRYRKIENEVKDEVVNAEDENGKPLYSNEQKRRTAIEQKIEEHPQAKEIQEQLDADSEKEKSINNEVSYLKRQFEIAKLKYQHLIALGKEDTDE